MSNLPLEHSAAPPDGWQVAWDAHTGGFRGVHIATATVTSAYITREAVVRAIVGERDVHLDYDTAARMVCAIQIMRHTKERAPHDPQ